MAQKDRKLKEYGMSSPELCRVVETYWPDIDFMNVSPREGDISKSEFVKILEITNQAGCVHDAIRYLTQQSSPLRLMSMIQRKPYRQAVSYRFTIDGLDYPHINLEVTIENYSMEAVASANIYIYNRKTGGMQEEVGIFNIGLKEKSKK